MSFTGAVLRTWFWRGTALLVGVGAGSNQPAVAADWIRLSTPEFTVISEVSESRTKAWAADFELFRRGISQLLPVESGRLQPVSMVLFASTRHFNPFKPLESGKPARLDGYFVRIPGRNVIALSVDGARDSTRERIFHEATHWHLSAFDRALPWWLEEGMGEVFGTFSYRSGSFTIGASRSEHLRTLRSMRPIPFAELMATHGGDQRYNGEHADRAKLLYAQSWAAAQLMVFGAGSPGWPALRAYLEGKVKRGGPAEEFAGLFGRSPSDLNRELASLLAGRPPAGTRAPLDRSTVESGFQLRPASAAEVDLALGGLLVGVGRPAEGQANFARAAEALPGDPRPLVGLGEVELAGGRPVVALAKFNDAIANGGGRDFFVHYLAAMAGMRSFETTATATGVFVARYDDAWRNLAEALRLNPRFVPAYELTGLLLTVPLGRPTIEQEALLREGASRYPSCPGIQLGLGFIAARKGQRTAARAHAQLATEMADSSTLPLKEALRLLEAEVARLEHARP